MLRLNAQYSKKVPAEQDYSSRGYAAEISVELPDNLTQEQLQQRIHSTFAMVETAVENEINKDRPAPAVPIQQVAPQINHDVPATPILQPPVTERSGDAISPRQLTYVNDLLKATGHDASPFLQARGLKSIYELSKIQAGQLIDLVKNQHTQAA